MMTAGNRVCGSMDNREVHHVFEWSMWNAMDRRKVTAILNAIEFYDDDYVSKAADEKQLKDELKKVTREHKIIESPDDMRNLVVLCMKHHRLKHTGIHMISFPLWLAMAGVPSEAGILSREQILVAVERVKAIDEQLAVMAENNYVPVE